MNEGVWQARVHRVSRSWTWLKRLSMHTMNNNCIQKASLWEPRTTSYRLAHKDSQTYSECSWVFLSGWVSSALMLLWVRSAKLSSSNEVFDVTSLVLRKFLHLDLSSHSWSYWISFSNWRDAITNWYVTTSRAHVYSLTPNFVVF